ncbi:hypothetical protein MHU86_22709 [Fragilaria crotonensis]|nr:hypothetical protein MHU86_22709 [Fragilaria crotonensis]
MDDTLLNEYIETVIVPLYSNMNKITEFDCITGKLNCGPVILKVDAGPGRIVLSELVLEQRKALCERGLIIVMGLPNATSIQQEMDALYGPFKSATYARGEKVVQAKLKQQGLARRSGKHLQSSVLNLDFNDLPTIVNGTSDDDERDRPFNTHFTKEKILWSWRKVGFVPFSTRSCLANKRVKKELGQHNKDKALEDLQFRSSSCGLGNEAARLKVADKKSEAQLKALEKARAPLAKYEFDAQSLTEKDWGDVVRWVLPEAKVPFLLKDLKKREQILAKLATLPNDWTTYRVPRIEVAPIVPGTTVE